MGAQKGRLNEYPQHIFWLRNKKKYFQLRRLILDGLDNNSTLIKCVNHLTSDTDKRIQLKLNKVGSDGRKDMTYVLNGTGNLFKAFSTMHLGALID